MEAASTSKHGPAIGQKRAYSAVDTDIPAPKKVILLHLNVILSSKKAIAHTLRRAISSALHTVDTTEVTDDAISLAFSKSPALKEILEHLGIRDLIPEKNSELHDCYHGVFVQEGCAMIQLAPHAKEFLSEAQQRDDISLAVASNNLGKATEILNNVGLRGLVDRLVRTYQPPLSS